MAVSVGKNAHITEQCSQKCLNGICKLHLPMFKASVR